MSTARPTNHYHLIRDHGIRLLAFALLIACAVDVVGTERVQRRFDRGSGLPNSEIFSVAQDGDGFFWIGTSAGLYRFDGANSRPWAPNILTGYVRCMGPDVSGTMLVLQSADQTLYRLNSENVEPMLGPDGTPFNGVIDAVRTEKRLWVARRETLFYSDDDLHWLAFSSPLAGEQIRRLSAGLNRDLYVSTRGGLWKITSSLEAAKLVNSRYVNGAVAHPDGFLYYVEKQPAGGRILQLHEGRTSEVAFLEANFNNFVLRGRTVWASFDRKTDESSMLLPFQRFLLGSVKATAESPT